jgi:hypothetical protein
MVLVGLVASVALAVPQIMPVPKEGKWTGDKCTMTVIPDRTTEPDNDFKGKLTIKGKTYDYAASTDPVKGTHGVYLVNGEQKDFEFVFDPNKNTGTVKTSDPYGEYEVKWTSENEKPK